MHAQGNTQLIETRVVHTGHMAIQVFSFVQSKLSEYQLCVPNWENSSEHDGAYHPSASRPANYIHNFNITIVICALKQAWC